MRGWLCGAWVYVNNLGESAASLSTCGSYRRCKYPTHPRRINIRPRGLVKGEINYLMESFLCAPCHVRRTLLVSPLALFLAHLVLPVLTLHLFLLPCHRIWKSCVPEPRNLSSRRVGRAESTFAERRLSVRRTPSRRHRCRRCRVCATGVLTPPMAPRP